MYKSIVQSLKPLIIAVAASIGVTSAIGATSLSLIPTLDSATANSARAITPDGKFVVGNSGVQGFLYQVGAANAIKVLSIENVLADSASGVGYRLSGGMQELIISGKSSGGWITEWMTTDGGATFSTRRRDTTWTANNLPVYNSLASTGNNDQYFITTSSGTDGNPVYVGRGSGTWSLVDPKGATMAYDNKGISGGRAMMNSVGASGRAVGWRRGADLVRNNYMITYTGGGGAAATYFNGLDGTIKGEAFSVSADGNTIFGQSPTLASTDRVGYKVVNPGASQVINALPLFGDETGTSRQVPYGCTADGKFAVGMAYRGTERAVFWDTSSADPTEWTVRDLTTIAQSMNDLDGFVRLSRAYSIGVDETGAWIIAGEGAWTGDGGATFQTRAFVMTLVPEPSTVSLLILGICGFLAARRRH